VRIKVVKNKVAPPFRQAEFDIYFGEGISREGYLVDMGIENGILEKSGTWILFRGEKIGQGRDQAKTYLKENKQIADEIEKLLREKLLPKQTEKDKNEIQTEEENNKTISQKKHK